VTTARFGYEGDDPNGESAITLYSTVNSSRGNLIPHSGSLTFSYAIALDQEAVFSADWSNDSGANWFTFYEFEFTPASAGTMETSAGNVDVSPYRDFRFQVQGGATEQGDFAATMSFSKVR
jgi:hypothetical protein